MSGAQRDPPVRITVERRSRRLLLDWADGDRAAVPFAVLRRQCPCSACRRLRADGDQQGGPDGSEVEQVRSMGYGIQIVFSDGHDRGIYPWQLLAALAVLATTGQGTVRDVDGFARAGNPKLVVGATLEGSVPQNGVTRTSAVDR